MMGKKDLKGLIEFLNSEEGRPNVQKAIETLYGNTDSKLKKIQIETFDQFFNIEYEIIHAILDSSFNDALKNDDIINRFSVAKGELENLKDDNKKIQSELSSLIISSIDMGVILKNLTTNCKVDSVKLENLGEENANFISICRIINRLIDNEYNYEFLKVESEQKGKNANQDWYQNFIKNHEQAGAIMMIFSYQSYKLFWQCVAKIPNIEFYFNNLLNSEIKFKDAECQKLQNRFLEYQKVRGKILEECTNKIREDPTVRKTSRPVYDIGFSIDKDGTLSLVKEVEILDFNLDIENSGKSNNNFIDTNGINDKKPFSFWKIILLLAIVLALGSTGFFGANAAFAFIAVVTNPLSIIITLLALALLLSLLVVAHKTGVFKVGKMFCSGKYEDESWFYLRQGKEYENEPEINTTDYIDLNENKW